MREILFRGKRKDNGEWVYGYYEFYNGGHYINIQIDRVNSGGYPIREFIEIDPSTVGQYTGLTDNGKRIFEGDVVKIDGKDYEVKYMLGQFFVGINMPIAYKRFDCEVIGNIHDNPELLESEVRE